MIKPVSAIKTGSNIVSVNGGAELETDTLDENISEIEKELENIVTKASSTPRTSELIRKWTDKEASIWAHSTDITPSSEVTTDKSDTTDH